MVKKLEERQQHFLQKCKENNVLDSIELLEPYFYWSKKIKCRCKKHKIIFNSTPSTIILGHGCPECRKERSSKLQKLSEDEYNKRLKEISPYLELKSEYINNKLPVTIYCNFCHNNIIVNQAGNIDKWQGCPFCGNNISYPNRLVRFATKELNPCFYMFEYSPEWIKPKKYDMYIEDKQLLRPLIIEMDGGFHKIPHTYDKRTKEELQKIDKYKTKEAEKRNIEVKRIDCDKKTYKEIMKELKQLFSEYFNISHMDWEKVAKNSEKNLIKECCDFYNNHEDMFIQDMAKEFCINRNTFTKYIKIGIENNWCKKRKRKPSLGHKRGVNVYNNEGKTLLYTFVSISECVRQLNKLNIKVTESGIERSMKPNRKKKTYKNMIFIYSDIDKNFNRKEVNSNGGI